MPRRNRGLMLLVGILTTIALGWVLYVGASILQPLVIAFLLASMLQPVVRGLKRVHVPPAVTVTVIVVLFFLGVARLGVLMQANLAAFFSDATAERVEPAAVVVDEPGEEPVVVVAPPLELYDETAEREAAGVGSQGAGEASEQTKRLDPFSSDQREAIERAGSWDKMVDKLGTLLAEKSRMPAEMRDLMVDQLRENGNALARGLVGGTLDFTKGLVLVVIYMLFIFAEQAVFRRKILAIAGPREHDAAQVLDTIGRGIQRYLGVKTLVSFVTGALAYAALVALGVPRALLFGILTFLLNYIPTFGSIIAAIFPTITALATYPDRPGVAVAVVIAYLAINLTLGNYIEPKVLGRELNLSPLVIIISVVVWAGLWGPVGTFLAVPLTAGLQIVLASYDSTRPIAVMMSSRPPPDADEAARGRRRRRRRSRDPVELDEDEPPAAGEGAERRPA